ncbi:MAG TPA: DUF1761 domain-containing protein [Gammaproteobacteria bacterium]|nr:DUF1761 domain-containing protein [Gammaproteobacteria bacterium]
MNLEQINYAAVITAAVSAFVVGGLWYSPFLFGNAWLSAAGLSEEKLKNRGKGHSAMVFVLSFIFALAGALVFALIVGPKPALGFSITAGFLIGFVWVAGSFAINYLFEARSFKLWAINGGYHTIQYSLYGIILGLWP